MPVLWAQGELRRAWNEGLICGEHLYHALNRQNRILQKGILLCTNKHCKNYVTALGQRKAWLVLVVLVGFGMVMTPIVGSRVAWATKQISCHRDFIDLRDKNGDLLCLAWVATPPIFCICICILPG